MSVPKILSVDDSRMVHMFIGRGFAAYDVDLVFASDGQEGLDAARKDKPSVILLDVTMPVMDGVECLAKLKADPELKSIPVIMLTAEAGKENVIKIAQMGAQDYIVKPVVDEVVVERVSRFIKLNPKAAPAPTPVAVVPKKEKKATDPFKILVIDEFATIIDSIKNAVSSRGWSVAGANSPEDAMVGYLRCSADTNVARGLLAMAESKRMGGHFSDALVVPTLEDDNVPDVILISLAFTKNAALSFAQLLKSIPALKNVPIVGLSHVTAITEQNDGKKAGITDFITKPINFGELPDSVLASLGLDITPLYFSAEGSVQVAILPQALSEGGSRLLARQANKKIARLVNAGFHQLLIDMTEVTNVGVPILRALTTILNECNTFQMEWRIVGASTILATLPTIVATNMKTPALNDISNPFQGMETIPVFESRDAALISF